MDTTEAWMCGPFPFQRTSATTTVIIAGPQCPPTSPQRHSAGQQTRTEGLNVVRVHGELSLIKVHFNGVPNAAGTVWSGEMFSLASESPTTRAAGSLCFLLIFNCRGSLFFSFSLGGWKRI